MWFASTQPPYGTSMPQSGRRPQHHLPKTAIANASGLFNLMRNLGGAIGIAVIDTIIFTRAPEIANSLVSRLGNGDMAAAQALGFLPDDLGAALLEPAKQAMLAPLIKRLAYVDAINEAWAVVAVATLIVLVITPLARGAANANSERIEVDPIRGTRDRWN